MKKAILICLLAAAAICAASAISRADTKSVEVNAANLTQAVDRIDMIVANVTGVLIDNQERGFTRREHKQIEADMQMLRVVVSTFIQQNEKSKEVPTVGEEVKAEAETKGQ